jgi:hypothetical protein
MKRQYRRGRRGTFILILIMGLYVVGFSYLLVRLAHFNPLTGTYTYDPRTDTPSNFFLANRPEVVLVDTLTKQIQRDGTYPPNATTPVAKITPLKVDISTYTDWQAYAYINTRLDYTDGTVRIETFRFHSSGSEGMVLVWPLSLVADITFHATYGRLTSCQELPNELPPQAACGLD